MSATSIVRRSQIADAGFAVVAICVDDHGEGVAAYDPAIRTPLIDAGLRAVWMLPG